MDTELRHYLNTVIVLLSLIIGFLATELLTSGVPPATFFVAPFTIGSIALVVVWWTTKPVSVS
jgi:hypothetical protein